MSGVKLTFAPKAAAAGPVAAGFEQETEEAAPQLLSAFADGGSVATKEVGAAACLKFLLRTVAAEGGGSPGVAPRGGRRVPCCHWRWREAGAFWCVRCGWGRRLIR